MEDLHQRRGSIKGQFITCRAQRLLGRYLGPFLEGTVYLGIRVLRGSAPGKEVAKGPPDCPPASSRLQLLKCSTETDRRQAQILPSLRISSHGLGKQSRQPFHFCCQLEYCFHHRLVARQPRPLQQLLAAISCFGRRTSTVQELSTTLAPSCSTGNVPPPSQLTGWLMRRINSLHRLVLGAFY